MWYTKAFNLNKINIQSPEFTNLLALKSVPQDPINHPEGDAFTHTMMVVNTAREIANRENLSPEDKNILVISALLHDIGKVKNTQVELQNGTLIPHTEYEENIHGPIKNIRAYGHDNVSMEDINPILSTLNLDEQTKQKILLLINLHMKPTLMAKTLGTLKDKS